MWTKPRRRRLGVVAGGLVITAALVAAGATSAADTSTGPSPRSDAAVFERATLTSDKADAYTFTSGSGAVTVNAPTTNTGINLRVLFWPAAGRVTADSQSCADWTSQTGPTQQGALMRIASLSNGGLRAILVTKNIWFYGEYYFNVYVVDTTHAPMLTRVGYVSLRGELQRAPALYQPLPWFMCARVTGDQVQILVWHYGEPPPQWGDRSHGGTVKLPAGWIYPGRAGWYIGHVPPGGSAGFTNLSTSATFGTATHTTTWADRDMVVEPTSITRAEETLGDVSAPTPPR